MKLPLLTIFCAAMLTFGQAHIVFARPIAPVASTDSLPVAFLLGENDGTDFAALQSKFETSLLTTCHSDMDLAYYAWVHLLQHIQTYAKQQSIELDGVKMWLYAFWNKDGSIAHIAYHLKPNSRNVKTDELTAMLARFAHDYKLPIKSDKDFSNYNNATFPVLMEKGAK